VPKLYIADALRLADLWLVSEVERDAVVEAMLTLAQGYREATIEGFQQGCHIEELRRRAAGEATAPSAAP